LQEIACPTLVVAARQDRLRSIDEAQELADAIPGARLEIIEDAGHLVPLEAPALLAGTLVRWLRDRAS
jgi:pimeloyl-ACP methyl ester carboxylesterase